jgi:TonB-linked SusC/RagA family outer membrane protein
MQMRKITLFLVVQLLIVSLVFAQQRTVTGKVTDDRGAAIAGASVMEKGTKNGASTNDDGTFSLRVKNGATLIISALSFENKQIKASAENLNVQLIKSTENLNEVVVTALGIRRQSKELGYAATTISNKVLVEGKSVNIQQALNGKVSGLNISTVNSGVFENAKINIRGIRSLTGNNQPMLVVDGAPTPLGYLSSIPPDDVQDLTVLKSAASAAIYGPDAVNGVIVITTKRGGKLPTVIVNSSVQLTKVSFFPKYQKTFGQGAGETLDQWGNYLYVPYENQQFGPAFDGTLKQIGVTLADGSVQTVPYSNGHFKDKVKFWNSGYTFQNSVSIAGEDFYLSVEDADIKGLVPQDVNRRTSLRFNGGKKYGKFSVNYGLNYVLQNYDVVNERALSTLFPSSYNGSIFFLVMQTASNIPLLQYKDWQNNKFAQYSNYYNEFAINPYWAIGNLRQHGREDDLIGDVDATYELFPWLKASARLSASLAFLNHKNSTAPIEVSDWAHANRSATVYTDRPGSVADDESYSSRINFDYFLSGDKGITKDFTFKYLAGGTIRQNKSKDVEVGGDNLVVPYLYNVSVRSGDADITNYGGSTALGTSGNNYDITTTLLSAYGSLGFNYKGWANLEFTGRNDWDSRLLAKNRSFFYPAANAAVVLSDAIPGLKAGILSYAKIRAAISKSGNVNLGAYALQATFAQPSGSTPNSLNVSDNYGFPYGNVAGYSAQQIIPNPNLKPEFVNTKEIGLELGFLKNRINVEATYFNQNNTDQILSVSQSYTTGYSSGLANAASFKNYGVEMDLGLTPLINIGKGKLDLKVNGTYNNNKVTSTQGNIDVIVGGNSGFIQNSSSSPTVNNIARVGLPAFAFQLTDYNRDPQGRVIVDATSGLPSEASNLIVTGRVLPLWVVGITPTYTVGNFSIAMTWDYKGGHNFYSGMGSDEDFAGISARSAEYGRKRFVFPNSVYFNGSKYVPNTSIQVQDGNAGFWTSGTANSDMATNYYASAAAWRLRELNISYNIPLKWIGNGTVIKRITVSAVGKNLLLFVPKSNQWGDPEFNYSTTGNTFGVSSSFQSPASRLFGGSITVQF